MQVQQSRSVNAYTKGAPKFDFFRMKEMAAHELRWKELFTPLRIFERTVSPSHSS